MKKNKTNAKIALILGSLFFYGCNSSETGEVLESNPPSVEKKAAPVAKAKKRMTYDEFAAEIIFKDGETVKAEREFSIESGNGIEQINLKNIYEESKGDIEVLNLRIKKLKEAYKVVPEEKTAVEVFHDSLHMAGDGSESGLLEYLKTIKSEVLTEEEFYKAHYALNLAGRYEEALELRELNCPRLDCRTVKVVVKGRVRSGEETLAGARISLLNEEGVYANTGLNGGFKFEYESIYPNKLRFVAQKKGFSRGFGDEYLFFEVEPEIDFQIEQDFELLESDGTVTLSDGLVSDSKGVSVTKNKDGSFQIDLDSGEASFVVKDFVDADGNSLDEPVVVDVFYFPVSEEDEIRDNYLDVDVMGEDISIIGNQFVTFGMPMIDLRTVDGDPVFIHKDNPSKVEFAWRNGSIDGERRDAKDFFSEENWDKMVTFSMRSDEDFPLDDKSLKKLFNGLGTLDGMYPIWWQLNYNTGMWEPAGFKILDKDGQKAQGMVYQID